METAPWFKVSSERLEKPWSKLATRGSQEWLYLYAQEKRKKNVNIPQQEGHEKFVQSTQILSQMLK